MYTTEFLDIPPLVRAEGIVRLPGSKSISNRVLLLAGLAQGTTRVHALLDSDDTRVMLDALRTLGCGLRRDGEVLEVTGIGGRLAVHQASLFLGNAGTAMRPLAAALAVLATTQGGCFDLHGVARMHERPIGDLVDALRPLGCEITCTGQEGYPPLRLEGRAGGRLAIDQPIRVRGNVSSQFLTALLLALPLVAADGDVTVEVVGDLISKPYVEITLNLLARFGIDVQRQGWQRFVIPAGSAYRSPGDMHVEGDASSASYFIALGAIAATAAPVRIEGVGRGSIQGDMRFAEAAEAMGAAVTLSDGYLEVRRGRWPLQAIDLDCNHIPDAAMTLAVMALYAEGTTTLRNIASWRVKETDRIAAMAAELRRLGAVVHEGDAFIAVTPPARWQPAAVHTYDDHRMAMCASLAAFNALAGAAPPVAVRILDPKCVGKTFPDYFEALFGLVEPAAGAVPVITIDGPTASGKGTLAGRVAERLGWHFLDSGSLYRVTALDAIDRSVPLDDGNAVAALVPVLAAKLRFAGEQLWLQDREVSAELRREDVGLAASRVSAHPAVRAALLRLQTNSRRLPGLVADGRDMGTVIYPDAPLKVFLTASPAMRAERRYKQLISKGIPATIHALRADLEARDERDRNRSIAPLKPAEDALLLDNSELTIDESVDRVLDWWHQRNPWHLPRP